MTSPSPASMGGPPSEAERARRLAEIRAHVEAANVEVPLDAPMKERTARVSAGIGLMTNGREYTEFLLNLVGVLEGQLATARGLHKPFEAKCFSPARVSKFCEECSGSISDGGDGYEPWPCKTARALGLDGGGPDER